MTEFSGCLFDTLDSIGYSQELVRFRRSFWQQPMHVLSEIEQTSGIILMITGSKAEGLSSFYQSDIDFLSIETKTICTDNVAQFSQLPNITVLHTDTSETPPGYTRLKIVRLNKDFTVSKIAYSAFESETNAVYLSSTLFATYTKLSFKRFGEDNYSDVLSGPAVQFYMDGMPIDYVNGFACYYPYLLYSWKIRPRRYDWPPVHVIEEAASMLAQIVPVGSKGSCDHWREWRICFIESELKLTCSLNEAQLKLYIILKMVAKDILRHDEISSYIMKNVVYWLSELLPLAVFERNNLFTLVLLSLRFLKSAINEWNWLPYYMIPGRNLLAERLTPDNRRELSELIKTRIEEGPQFLLRCTKLRTVLSVRLHTPALLRRDRESRNRIEMLLCYKYILLKRHGDRYDLRKTDEVISDSVLPEWRMMLSQGVPAESLSALMSDMLHAKVS